MIQTRSMDLLGHRFRFVCDLPLVVSEFEKVFEYYLTSDTCGGAAASSPSPELEFYFHVVPESEDPNGIDPASRRVHAFEILPDIEFELLEEDGILWTVIDRRDWTRIDYKRGRVDVYTHRSRLEIRSRYAINVLLFPALCDFFQMRSKYFLHCAGLEKEGRSVVLAGPSGGGKTSLTLALARAGYGVLADDLCLLRSREGRSWIAGFRERLNVRPSALAFFPDISVPRNGGDPSAKIPCRVEDLFPSGHGAESPGALILFPEIGDPANHQLVPLAAGDALARLACSGLFVTGPRCVEQRTFALIDLLEQAPAFVLRMGTDMASVHRLVDRVIEDIS